MSFLFYTALVLFLLLCVLLCFVILIQESKSMGLGASFGGDAGDSVFGASTAEVLKKFTAWLAIIFICTCVVLSFWSGSVGKINEQVMPTTIEEKG